MGSNGPSVTGEQQSDHLVSAEGTKMIQNENKEWEIDLQLKRSLYEKVTIAYFVVIVLILGQKVNNWERQKIIQKIDYIGLAEQIGFYDDILRINVN